MKKMTDAGGVANSVIWRGVHEIFVIPA